MRQFNLNDMVKGYMVCALWSSVVSDDDGNNTEPMDDNYSIDDIAPECAAAMRAVCEDFAKSNHVDLQEYCTRMRTEQWSGEERAGHDFWLTRNGHGAGFWDRGLGALGDRLSAAAKVYSSVDLYPGDDGLIYGETQ